MEKFWRLIDTCKNHRFDNEKIKATLDSGIELFDINESKEALAYIEKLVSDLINKDDYESLHEGNGGFYPSGDDGFYSYMPNWVILQGKEVYDATMKDSKFIETYVKDNNVPMYRYEYEGLKYHFYDRIEKLEYDIWEDIWEDEDIDEDAKIINEIVEFLDTKEGTTFHKGLADGEAFKEAKKLMEVIKEEFDTEGISDRLILNTILQYITGQLPDEIIGLD